MNSSPKSDAPGLPRWLPLALLGTTLMALFHRLLLGEVLFWGLPSLQFYPWREFAMSELAQGRLPLWNPYNGAGAPLLADYQIALLYPPHALYWLWSGPQTMGYLGILHLAWAALGMWLLTRRFDLPILARGIATLAYPLSNTLVARFGTFPMLDVAAWLPWLILATDALIDGVTLLRTLALTGVIAMQLLAGHAQWMFYSFILAGAYGLWRVVAEKRRASAIRILAGAVFAVILGAGIAAAQLLPTAELQRESQRAAGLDEEFALNFSYAPLSLITLFNPNFFGNPGDGSYVINGVYFETAAYIGILPITLAILGTIRYFRTRRKGAPGPRDYLIPFFTVIAIMAIVLAFGRYTPIYPLLYRHIPTFSLFQAPARWLLLAVFSLTMLAALAVPGWMPTVRLRRRSRLALIIAISLIVAGLAGQLLLHNAQAVTVQLTLGVRFLGILLLAVAVIFLTQPPPEARSRSQWEITVLAFVAVDLWWANALSNPSVPLSFYDRQSPVTTSRVFWPDDQNRALPDVAFQRYLPLNDYRVAVEHQAAYRQSMLPNLNLLDRQPSLSNFEPLRPDRFERFTRLLNSLPSLALLRAAGVGKVYDSPGMVKDVPRVWLVPNAISAANADEAERLISAADWDPYQTVVVEGKMPDNLPGGKQSGTVRITAETPLSLDLSVDSPGGLLVIADTYYPGWEATIDETPTPIHHANLAFRAVPISKGQHQVHMIYQPRSFTIGSLISVGSLLVYGVLGALGITATSPARRRRPVV